VAVTALGGTTSPVAHRGLITVAIMLATIMQALDTTIAVVALPHMQGSIQASQDQISWVLTSYIVATAIATPLTGWLCSCWGRRSIFLLSVAGFTIASALCGFAGNLWQIVGARLLQGMFGAALVPLSQAVMLDINPREKFGQAMAIWGAGIMIGPILGPVVGGWLTEHADWRWVFFVNLPIGVIAFAGILRYLPESRPASASLDVFGFVTLSLAVGFLQLFLDRGQQQDWFESSEIRIEAAVCVTALAFFVAHTWTSIGASFLNRGLLHDRNFLTGMLFSFIIGVILFATLALLPTLLQGLLGYPVVHTGMLMAPRGIGTMLAMMLVGRLMHWLEARTIMAAGFALTVAALYWMTSMTLDMDSRLIVSSGFLQGLGIGFTFIPLSAATFATLPAHLRNDGTPIFSLVRNIGSSVGISIVTALLSERTSRAHAELSSDIHAGNLVLAAMPAAFDPTLPTGLAMLDAEVSRQAAMMAYVFDFHFMMLITLAAMPLLLLIRSTTGTRPVASAMVDPGH
jgi:DHA2 family multidrug resistance protein